MSNDNPTLVTEMEFIADGVSIHLVSLADNREAYALYVTVDGGDTGALIAQFDPKAGLEAVIAFIMALQTAAPHKASQKVQDLLASIAAEETES